ncbi:hypothetical protein [Aliiruegeria lutimaris]|uniref:Lipoprotein n=1 Tax=Aliiruegeria lutimaris TaxID=571298 RepID=A0A1G8P543_9RHOB|nr:hypothetical protein [Aliiruegeria lutimaris]SDI87455.1 hypothetical protein SAMN04488026_100868 [Aliiruegeria lutimaris]
MKRFMLALCLPLILAACGDPGPWASDEAVAKAAYRADEPPTVTLFTMVNNRSNEGAHSALMVNASQRVIFNPAGTFHHPYAPQRADVHYGITDNMVDFFIDYHARETYRVIRHDIQVTPQQAEMILARVQSRGAVPNALCTTSIGTILRDVPGFENAPRSPFPKSTMRFFDEYPGVTIRRYYDDSADDRSDIVDSPEARKDIVVLHGPDSRSANHPAGIVGGAGN